MDVVIFNLLIIFGTIFGIFYLAITARTRVRLAMIEKGADASLFYSKTTTKTNVFQIILVNISLLLFSVGVGIFIAAVLHQDFNVLPEVAYPGTIFTVAGMGLFVGYKVTARMGKENNNASSPAS